MLLVFVLLRWIVVSCLHTICTSASHALAFREGNSKNNVDILAFKEQCTTLPFLICPVQTEVRSLVQSVHEKPHLMNFPPEFANLCKMYAVQ